MTGPEKKPVVGPLLLEQFARWVADKPEKTAVSIAGEHFSYAELDRRANQLAHRLIAEGVKQQDCVGLCAEPSVELIIGMLAILKCGAAYVPLDPSYPPERLHAILETVRPLCVVVGIESGALPDGKYCRVDISIIGEPVSDPGNPAVVLQSHHLCYVMFTSGSAGKPNGVMVTHGNVAGLFGNVQGLFSFDADDRWLALHSFAFGFSVWEIWGALSTGGTLVMVPASERGDPQAWYQTVRDERVTVLSITPSGFSQWLMTDFSTQTDYLRLIVFSGEAARSEDIAAWFQHRPEHAARLVNTYALTETAGRVASFEYRAGQSVENGSIGVAVADAELLILDPQTLALVDAGATGELFVTGPMVAAGYYGDDALTEKRFLELSLNGSPSQRVYRTGDRAAQKPDGSFVFHGRADEQIKLRGHRIELREIEHILRAHPAVADVAVIVDDQGPSPVLKAFTVPKTGADGEVEFWPSLGEYQIYDELLYDFMSADEVRVASYRRAFQELAQDRVVLDIGTGKDALLARLCVAAGARKVYAVEVIPEAAMAARSLVEKLQLQDKIEVIQGDLRDIDLPEAVSLCTQGIVGNIGSSDGIVSIWNNARRFFTPDVVAVPGVCTTFIAPAELPASVRDNPAFTTLAADYVQRIFSQEGSPFDVRLCVRNFSASGMIADAAVFEVLEFLNELRPDYSNAAEFVVTRNGYFDGFVLWTRIFNSATEVVDFLQHQQAWLPVWFPVAADALPVCAGDIIRAEWSCITQSGQIFPDYHIETSIQSAQCGSESFSYSSRHHETALGQSGLHRKLLQQLAKVAPGAGGQDLHQWAASKLPEYMVPAQFNWISELPLTANRKLDREALARISRPVESGVADVVALSPFEVAIRNIWCAVLGIDRIAPDAHFFALGGDSILAVRLTTEVQRYLDDTVFLAALFDAPTVSAYEAWLEEHHAEAISKLKFSVSEVTEKVASSELPASGSALSWSQQSLWFLAQLYPENTGGNEQFLIRMRGIDREQLAPAWRALIERHDIFRSQFAGTTGTVEQVVLSAAEYPGMTLPAAVDFTERTPEQANAALFSLAQKQMNLVFDLSNDELLRPIPVYLPDTSTVLLVTAHHIIADGLCVPLIRDELAALMLGQPLVSDVPEFVEFTLAQQQRQQGGWLEQEVAWWVDRLEGISGLPVVAVTESAAAAGHEVRIPFELSAEIADKLKLVARSAGATPFMALLALWRIWLARCFSESDFLIGSPMTLRQDERSSRMMGCLVNNVAFRNPLTLSMTLADVLVAERTGVLTSCDHGVVPFEAVVAAIQPERIYGRHPLFQIMFQYEDRKPALKAAGGAEFSTDVLPVNRASYWDLDLSVTDLGSGSPLSFVLGVRRDLFDVDSAQDWPGSFLALLNAAVAKPDRPIAELPLLGRAQIARLDEWAAPALNIEAGQTLSAMVAAQAARSPDAPAIVDEAEVLSYRELMSRATMFSSALTQRGIVAGSRVALCASRSADVISLILAVNSVGAIWLPLDPDYPTERLQLMLRNARPDLLIADNPDGWPDAIALSALVGEIPAESSASLPHTWSDVLCTLYTSGSTGVPKAAMVSQSGAISRCVWMWGEFNFSPDDIFAQRTSLNFIDSVWEIFGALLHGAQVAILPAKITRDISGLAGWLLHCDVTHLVLVPSLLEALLDQWGSGKVSSPGIHTLICSGETLSPQLLARARSALPACRILNTYGTSEAWDITCARVDELPENIVRVPIGLPLPNVSVLILDSERRRLPAGIAGELWAGGIGVLQAGDEVLMFESSGGYFYRTGDRARFRHDGKIELLGRVDRQLKLRGTRIEPGDIEAVVQSHASVSKCAVVLREADSSLGNWLALFLTLKPGYGPDENELRSWLRRRLPLAMVPSEIVYLPEMPLTPSGKVDMLALPVSTSIVLAGYSAPDGPAEQQLAAIWADVLQVPRVGRHDDFFTLRGNSLLATQVIARVCDNFSVDLPLQCLFESPTVAGLANSIEAIIWTQGGATDTAGAFSDREVLRL